MSGSGVDFSYDETRDLIGISDQTKVKFAADKTRCRRHDITSGAAVLSRTDDFVSFERAVHIVRGTQVIDAESALGELTDEGRTSAQSGAAGRGAHRNTGRLDW